MQSIEFCAGAGGQAIGLEQAGFRHSALVEIERDFAKTLQVNRPGWNVFASDMNEFDGRPYKGVDLFAVVWLFRIVLFFEPCIDGCNSLFIR